MTQFRVRRGSFQRVLWCSHESVESVVWLSEGAAWLSDGAAWLSEGAG